ncbi:MAG: hypothetical protein J6D02_09060 [Lachnospira sp.]|nr:hypothetical protein [Lachnospira sp.]
MKKCVVGMLMIVAMLMNITQGYAEEMKEKDGKIYLENADGVGITREEYNKLRANYSENEIAKMDYSELMNLQDGDMKIVDKQTLYVKTDYYKDKTGQIRTEETIISPDKVEQELAKINNRLFADKRDAISLQAVGDDYHRDFRQTAMKEMRMKTMKNSAGTAYTVTLQNTWRSMPAVRSLDVTAIRFGAVNGLTVYKAEETYAHQIWNGNVIKYSSTSDKFHYNTSGSANGKAGVGVTMNLKDDASSLTCYLQVRYSASALYAYSIYGAYEHATAAVSDTSYTFSPTGMGGVIEFKKNAGIYDNTTGLSVLADR